MFFFFFFFFVKVFCIISAIQWIELKWFILYFIWNLKWKLLCNRYVNDTCDKVSCCILWLKNIFLSTGNKILLGTIRQWTFLKKRQLLPVVVLMLELHPCIYHKVSPSSINPWESISFNWKCIIQTLSQLFQRAQSGAQASVRVHSGFVVSSAKSQSKLISF